jgi:hypothetical protein
MIEIKRKRDTAKESTTTTKVGTGVQLAPPWIAHYHKIQALFEHDPDVKVMYNNDDYTVTIGVVGDAKAQAITRLVKPEVVFGNITLKIKVVPANTNKVDIIDTFKTAFSGNPTVVAAEKINLPGTGTANHVVFRKEVVQFFNDDIGDVYGVESTLFENIANDVFVYSSNDPVYYSTDIKDPS